jgi:hypothetical protein
LSLTREIIMNEFYMDRHFKLWEENNKQINRVVFLTVVLSLALFIKVLIPFVDFSEDKKPVIQKSGALKVEKEIANEKIDIIKNTATVLEDVNKFIDLQPWQKEKKDLIKRYKDMRESPSADSYTREHYQQEANDTINRIAELLQKNILQPLQQSTVGIMSDPDNRDALVREVDSLEQFIADWKNEYINKNWYRTIDRKDITMYQLTESLNQRLGAFSDVVKRELMTVNTAMLAADKELKTLNAKIEMEADKLQLLDDELQKILPEWLRGLIRIEQVIQLLPATLLVAAVFVVGPGVSLTRHYEIYSSGKKFTREITEDPGMSTTWTLIYSGLTGTIMTKTAYTVFIILSWLLFEESMTLLLEWLSIDASTAWISSHGFWAAFLWLSRAVFVLLLAYIFIILKSKRMLSIDDEQFHGQ